MNYHTQQCRQSVLLFQKITFLVGKFKKVYSPDLVPDHDAFSLACRLKEEIRSHLKLLKNINFDILNSQEFWPEPYLQPRKLKQLLTKKDYRLAEKLELNHHIVKFQYLPDNTIVFLNRASDLYHLIRDQKNQWQPTKIGHHKDCEDFCCLNNQKIVSVSLDGHINIWEAKKSGWQNINRIPVRKEYYWIKALNQNNFIVAGRTFLDLIQIDQNNNYKHLEDLDESMLSEGYLDIQIINENTIAFLAIHQNGIMKKTDQGWKITDSWFDPYDKLLSINLMAPKSDTEIYVHDNEYPGDIYLFGKSDSGWEISKWISMSSPISPPIVSMQLLPENKLAVIFENGEITMFQNDQKLFSLLPEQINSTNFLQVLPDGRFISAGEKNFHFYDGTNCEK